MAALCCVKMYALSLWNVEPVRYVCNINVLVQSKHLFSSIYPHIRFVMVIHELSSGNLCFKLHLC